MRARRVTLVGVIVAALYASSHESNAEVIGNSPIPVAQSQLCPAGPTTSTFMLDYRCPNRIRSRVFDHGGWFRVLRATCHPFTANCVRNKLAEIADVSEEELSIGLGLVSFTNGEEPESRATEGGDGFAFAARSLKTSASVVFCRLQAGNPVGDAAACDLGDTDILLISVTLDGQSHIVAMRALLPRETSGPRPGFTAAFLKQKEQFQQSVRESGDLEATPILPDVASASAAKLLSAVWQR